ncbi:MAG: phosphoglycolate phosphatase [Sulfurovum sp.]|nr:MAG: phosphoglycolate phosphatase [Sulfurovum sp.]
MNSKLVNKKLLIFDLDGTLIHSALDLAISVNLMLEKLGENPFKEEIIHGWVGNGAHTLVWRALSGKKEVDTTLDKSYLSDALALFLKLYEKNLCVATKPYPHVKETLTSLKSKGYRLSLVSNKPFQFIEPILKKLALDGFFEIILGGDSLEKKKPDSLPLLYVCNTLGIDITQSVMIGDSKNDIQAANACQMDSIAVTYGYNYGEDIALYHPSIIINDFKDLIH